MKTIARTLIHAALADVDPFQAVIKTLHRQNNWLTCGKKRINLNDVRRVFVVGFGKAGAPMAHAVHTLLADTLTGGIVITKYGHTLPPDVALSPIEVAEADHPIPDENGVAHTRRLMDMLAQADERDLVICLISGGGSALLTQPAAGVSLAEIQTLTQHLLAAGAPITEVNTIRKHLSQVKGGQLAQLAHPAALICLIISDVGGDPLDIIASGPTVPDPSTFADASAIVERYHLASIVPASIMAHLNAGAASHIPETPKPGQPDFSSAQNLIIAGNKQAVQAATQKALNLGLNAAALLRFIEGEAREVAAQIAALGLALSREPNLFQKPMALILGGETTVTLHGNGLGGRNQELALATALHIQDVPNLLVAYFATDGNDGPTDAAGAFATGQTVANGAALGLNAEQYLARNDSYHFFKAINELIITGPTNTNVNDLVLLFVW